MFQTSPSKTIFSLILLKRATRSCSCSKTLTSKTTVDLAAGLAFTGLEIAGFAGSITLAGVVVLSSSPKRSSYSTAGAALFSSTFFSSLFFTSSFLPSFLYFFPFSSFYFLPSFSFFPLSYFFPFSYFTSVSFLFLSNFL